MDRPTSWRAGAAVLALIWLIGGGLLAAPLEIGQAIRSTLRDGLAPGQRGAIALRRRVDRLFALMQSNPDWRELAHIRDERDRWQRRFLELQIQHARLASRDAQPDARAATGDPPEIGEPLLAPDLLPATVLGSERKSLEPRLSRLLNRGVLDGVVLDDLVLDDLPHLDQGADHGVAADMPVLAGRSVIGRIKQVGRWTSTVQLLTDPAYRGFAQLVRVSPRGPVFGAAGVLAGDGDAACRLDLVAATEPVSVGDFVYTVAQPGESQFLACYGTVTAAEVVEGAVHWTISVSPSVDVGALETVQVLREMPNPVHWASASNEEASSSSGLRLVRHADETGLRPTGAAAQYSD